MSGFDNKKSWATNLPLHGLIDPDRSPDVLSVEHVSASGNTVFVDLMKQKQKDGSILYVGTPVAEGGKRCKFALILETNGYFRGSAAMNFIVQGGWGKGTVKPDMAKKAEHRNKFIRSVLSEAIVLQGLDKWDELKLILERDTGLTTTEGEMTPEDRGLYALVGVKAFLVNLAATRGLRFEVDVAKAISKYVQPTYAAVEQGDWDAESEEVSLTSALTEAHVQLMTSAGLRFKKVRRARQARRNTAQK